MVDWLGVVEIALGATRPEVPAVDRARCLAMRCPSTACVGCVVACPRGAIDAASRPEIAVDRCDGCGACTAACPTGALSSARLDETKRSAVWAMGAEPRVAAAPASARAVVVRCEQAEPMTDSARLMPDPATEAVLPCLAAMRAADIVLAVAGRGGETVARLTLGRGDCAACPRLPAVRDFDERVAVARESSASLGVAAPIDVVTGASPSTLRRPATMVSRRGLFGLARDEARRAVVDAARSVEPVHARLARRGSVPEWRVMIGRLVESQGDRDSPAPGGLPVELGAAEVHVGATCDGCGLCVLACPLGLMAVVGDRAVVRGDGCTACGLCVEMCAPHAIDLTGIQMARETVAAGVSFEEMRTEPVAVAATAAQPGSHPADVQRGDLLRGDLLSADRLAVRATTLDRAMRAAGHGRMTSTMRVRTDAR